MNRFFLGVDLGKERDATALAVVERAVVFGEMSYVTYAREETVELRLRHAERVRLGTAYGEVVEKVRRMARNPEMAGRVTVVADATGVGAPVVEMLRKAEPGLRVLGVTITGTGRAREVAGGYHVSREELLNGLATAVERREFRAAMKSQGVRELVDELVRLRVNGGRVVTVGESHDDLVMAAALAVWRARAWRSIEGKGRIV